MHKKKFLKEPEKRIEAAQETKAEYIFGGIIRVPSKGVGVVTCALGILVTYE